jgi:hypothetical protein
MYLQCRSCFAPTIAVLAIALTACSDPNPSSITSIAYDEVAIAEEETLKGDATEQGGWCPEGYFIIEHPVGEKYDVNRNGFICYDGFSHAVDDVLVLEGADTEFAGGHGNFDDIGKKGETQHVSFSFHGRQNKTMVVKGEFEMHDFINDLRIHGEVNCLVVEKNTATLSGIITQSTDKKLAVGSSVMWRTVDNGEGINEPVDFISRPVIVKTSKEGCKGKLPALKEIKILSGNIQVLQ